MNHKAFQDQLAQFPVNAADILQQLVHQQGRLEPEQVNELKGLMELTSENLLKALFPLAASMSTCPISHFSVGAIVEGFRSEGQGPVYLGANLETAGQPLKMTIHAEQAAICNAWHQGETRLCRLIVNEAPCGHCRQFMNELHGINQMDILVSPLDSGQQRQYRISNLLPDAFGPGDLKQSTRLMSPSQLSFESPNPVDKLVNAATEAARRSYAPYSGCHSGIALLIDNGDIVSGRYAENAAFNPGMTAVEAALVNLRLSSLAENQGKVIDAVLVERQAPISHQGVTASIISHIGAELRYFVV
ncbi:cytidine deaminase [Endozoicomonas sp. SCSIO W0465]|uniref:cytidine deaminase n=1 Tax=Endozoicomonas sp. SCSIO W0465 TaxID=2918516 RepID=UPI0020751A72|nr:cytidine deaminase [Endozoicomonas sp. SCSIO W0465]USE36604.1 cytidine deaminase [Endozoicomonas sp. SCSIO W0465]